MTRDLSNLTIMPFGAQYYRAPTPEPTEWKSDMEAMRAAGFNTIKIWAQWRWNHPAENKFYFDDLDQLMDLAAANSLDVVINTILDCAPAWLYHKYPECVMLNAEGRKVGPVVLPHRQIGGAPGPCFHHPEAMVHMSAFVAEVVKRYAGHSALLAWDLWNEPELTVGMLREAKVENLVCYCENSRRGFVHWLDEKYGGIDALNHAWHRNYANWDELELPVVPTVFKDMVDWRMFFVDTVTRNMEERARVARVHDDAHPIMCHTVPTPHFNPITCGTDDWELSKCCDLFGNSIGSDPMAADTLRSAARGKTVINAEIHAIPGSTFYRPQPIGLEEMKRHVLVPLAHGIKGFLFWQYRPELLGVESPAWGLTFPDGSPAPWMESVSRICRALVSDSDFFLSAERIKPQVALFTSPANEIFCWGASLSTQLCQQSLSGAYKALERANYSVDFLHPNDIRAGVLDEHKVLYVPLGYWIDPEVLQRIKEWVHAGGCLISECSFGGIDTSTGYFSMVTPGSGFDQVFSVREGTTYPESGVLDSYSWQAGASNQGITFTLATDVGSLAKGTTIPGHLMGASLNVSNAEVIAHFPTGEPAATIAGFGSGSAVMVGTLLGAAYAEKSAVVCAELIAELVGRCCSKEDLPEATPSGDVRIDVLTSGDRRWIMVQNLSERAIEAQIKLPFALKNDPVEMFTGERPRVSAAGFGVTLLASQIKAFWA